MHAVLSRQLGRSGLQVSALGLGCWAIGGPAHNLGMPIGWSTAEDNAVSCAIQEGLASGANEFFEFGRFEGAIGPFFQLVIAL